MNDLLEKLAEIEHEQWCAWSLSLIKTENISENRSKRWEELWIPYEKLSEHEKDQDRRWARKVLEAIK